jgi:hypothetical protein
MKRRCRRSRLVRPAIAVASLLLATPSALAEGCGTDAAAGETVVIAMPIAASRILLEDGRHVRLAGLDPASLRLNDLSPGEATLVAGSAPDRHGDVRGDLVVDGDSLSIRLASQGLGRVRPAAGDQACYAALLAGEADARRAGLGLWSEAEYAVQDAGDPLALSRHEGRFVVVSGRVRHVGATRTMIWIDFGHVWRTDVTIVISKKHQARFMTAGKDPAALKGKMIRARGVVTMRDGPRIEITEPSAIEWIEADGR